MHYVECRDIPVKVSRLGFGSMVLAGTYGDVDRAQAIRVLRDAVDLGITLFDTADVYGAGENEKLLAEALGPVREKIVLATKGGATRDSSGAATNNGSPDYLTQACEASLKRLNVDTIDIYYLHRVDPSVPIEDSVGALSQLVQQGKVRTIGLSEVNPLTLRRAHAVHPISFLQTEYSLACRFPEDDILAACSELGVAFCAYSPLGRGLLGGQLPASGGFAQNDMRSKIPRFDQTNLQANLSVTQRLASIAEGLGVTTAQLALAWVLSNPEVPFAIPGTRSPERLRQNVRAADLAVPGHVLDELNDLFAPETMRGERHTAAMLARTGL